MAPLGTQSRERLAGVKDITQMRAAQLADLLTAHGGDLTIPEYGGLRDDATQALLVKFRDDSVATGGDWYPVAPPGKSNHRTGDAFDADVLIPAEGMTVDETYALLGQLAPSIGLRWGGTFRKPDKFHFENEEVAASGPVTVETGATAAAADEAAASSSSGSTSVLVLAAVVVFGVVALYLTSHK